MLDVLALKDIGYHRWDAVDVNEDYDMEMAVIRVLVAKNNKVDTTMNSGINMAITRRLTLNMFHSDMRTSNVRNSRP